MKAFNIFLIILFIFSAALQYNDPDPYIWMPIYLYAAFICFRAIQKRYNRILYFIGLAAYIPYAAFLFFDREGVLNWIRQHQAENIVQTMKATKPWIEETREFFGLVIVITALLINMMWLSRMKR